MELFHSARAILTIDLLQERSRGKPFSSTLFYSISSVSAPMKEKGYPKQISFFFYKLGLWDDVGTFLTTEIRATS